MLFSHKSKSNKLVTTCQLEALECLNTNVMVADEDYTITYMNDGVIKLLTEAERELQKDLPNFSVARLLGSNIDIFHKNPAHQRRMLDALTGMHRVTIKVGGRTFDLIATAIFDSNSHKRIGTVVEWTDATQRLRNLDFSGLFTALSRAQAIIEFELDGTIITANQNFLDALGYSLAEIQGKHHSIFVESSFAKSKEYQEMWTRSNHGEYVAGEFKRLGKNGREVWIQASYNPILDEKGKPIKVVKFAIDVTRQKLVAADSKGQLDAISKAQAVIEFNLDGTVITANDNFLHALGYSLHEIKGNHHRMFVDPAEAQTPAYQQFWEKLRRGEHEARVYKCIGKGGKEVWIQASYNPIFDLNGKPFKVVKYATEVTEVIKAATLADQTSANVQSVAAAVEEMSASVLEISKNMTLSKEATDNIIAKTHSSGQATEQLVRSMKSMETIVELISSIASQVNLLALNATIEAARAGDAGKGFAVVAAEVKNLATQTAKATEDISREISAVQTISAGVASGVQEIVAAANSVDHYVTGVAGAVEEQTAVTREISANVQIAATSVADIAHRIKKLSATE